MAEGPTPAGAGLDKLTDEVTCPICQGLFDDPKILPCLHYYCKKCIERLLARVGQGQPFPCPECRKQVTLPRNDAGQLPTAFFVNRLRTVQETMVKAQGKVELTCEQCHTADAKAQAFCRHCTQFICEFCEQAHRRFKTYLGHAVVKLEELQRNTSENLPIVTAPPMVCSKHEEQLKIYCIDCDQLICHYCSALEHKSHRYEFVKTYANEVKETLTKHLLPVRAALGSVSAASARVRDKQVAVRTEGERMEQSVNEAFDTIIQAVERRRVEMVDAARKAVGEKLDKLAAQEKQFGMLHVEVESLLMFADRSLSSASDGEILSIHKQVLQRVEETSRTLESVNLRPTDEPTLALKLPDAGKVSSDVAQGSAIVLVEGSGVAKAETKKEAKLTLHVRLCNVQNIKAKLHSVFDNSVTKVAVADKVGVYELSFRPMVRGRHRLSICLNDDPTSNVQIPVFIKHPPTELNDPVRKIEGINPHFCCIRDEHVLATTTDGTVVSVDRRASGGRDMKTVVENLKDPRGIAADEHGFVYVAECDNSRVQVFDKDWKVVKTLNKIVSQAEELNNPWGLAVGANQKLYVCDDHRVQVFDKDLRHIQSIVPKDGKEFSEVVQDAACDDSGNVYAADYHATTVYKFDKDGQLIATIETADLHNPVGLCVRDEHLYIAEDGSDQIAVYTVDGKHVTSFGEDSLTEPYGIAIDADGFVYVCSDSCIVVF